MTREEAINNIKELQDTYITSRGEEDTVAVSLDGFDIEALDIAIKALEQQAILEKIKEVVCKWKDDSFTDGFSWDCMKEIADIVDKAESEGT